MKPLKLQPVLLLTLAILFCYGCQEPADNVVNFEHDLSSGPTPWSHENFNNQSDQFTFAIISDLNGGEREGIFSVAVEQINLFRPEFVLSVGDLIDGGTEDQTQLTKEWESFDARAARLNAPFFHLGGNHDLTNVAMRDFWKKRYGPRYYHFRYKDVLFLMMDSEDYEEDRMQEIYEARAKAIEVLDGDEPEKYPETAYYSMQERRTGEISPTQNAYFEQVLRDHSDVKWTFILMHKPVWMREEGNNFGPMEALLRKRSYTVINGHFHAYSHQKKNDRDYIILGTTGGSQNPSNEGAYDHITLVTMTANEPDIINVKLARMLDKTGKIPLNGDTLEFEPTRQ
ncbi:MAG: hypothetical protein HEP71_20370 [Roseivirga sp.]|nr:hypothetical protein [Roseivirga sp.]